MRWLQDFFTEFQRDKTLRSSEISEAFLSITDKKAFEQKKKQINKQPAPKAVKEMKHLEGKLDVELSPHKLNLSKCVANYIQNVPNLYQELMININNTSKAISLLSDCFNKTAYIFKRLGIANANIEVGV